MYVCLYAKILGHILVHEFVVCEQPGESDWGLHIVIIVIS